MEFDRFVNSSDRLDLLGIDREGNLVVVELKRSPLAGSADLQAIRYAAMVSSMTIKTLLPYYLAYLQRYCDRDLSQSETEAEIRSFVIENSKFEELSSNPRIILCSEGFSQEITSTVLWLNQSKLDITCVEVTPYKHCGSIVIVPRVIIPLPESKQYLIDIKSKEETVQQATKGRKGSVMPFLIENGLVKAGDVLLPKAALPSWVEYVPGDDRFE